MTRGEANKSSSEGTHAPITAQPAVPRSVPLHALEHTQHTSLHITPRSTQMVNRHAATRSDSTNANRLNPDEIRPSGSLEYNDSLYCPPTRTPYESNPLPTQNVPSPLYSPQTLYPPFTPQVPALVPQITLGDSNLLESDPTIAWLRTMQPHDPLPQHAAITRTLDGVYDTIHHCQEKKILSTPPFQDITSTTASDAKPQHHTSTTRQMSAQSTSGSGNHRPSTTTRRVTPNPGPTRTNVGPSRSHGPKERTTASFQPYFNPHSTLQHSKNDQTPSGHGFR